MSFARLHRFRAGADIFARIWVTAPGHSGKGDGLGPLYNAASCRACHIRDGRGRPPAAGTADGPATSLVLRLGVRVGPEPTYGRQLQDAAVAGHRPEGRIHLAYRERAVVLDDGTEVRLIAPRFSVVEAAYGPLAPDHTVSARTAPPMIGLGLLEAIEQADILAAADPEDADGDGISGRPNWLVGGAEGGRALGRFGWKAGQPSILAQTAHALGADMGIGSPILPGPAGDCTERQPACLAAPDGARPGDTEIAAEELADLAFYARHVGVPARGAVDDPATLRGKRLFHGAGCIACHRPKFITRRDAPEPEHAHQLIWPYTDLLLHDMGAGLADHQGEAGATGREWRTPPLWGIGLTQAVSGHTRFLHDGRARSLMEAVLWHGGEAAAARRAVVAMSAADRAALIRFLRSL